MMVIILRGIPGSGKSTKVKALTGEVVTCSADEYMTDEQGAYKFERSRLDEVHGRCLRKFVFLLEQQQKSKQFTTIVVDNTNTTNEEVAPYAALALAYGRPLRIVTLICDPKIAAQRNVHHASFETCYRMSVKLAEEVTRQPVRWPSTVEPAP